jgi:hypothetical protein
MKNKLKFVNKIMVCGILLALFLAGCQNGLLETGHGGNGNVTVTITANNAARTLRPNDINLSIFERIELVFSKDGASKILEIPKGQSSGTISLETGLWNISAKGFIKIDDREYEAAQGYTSCNVTSGSNPVSLSLQTGIFTGKPGVLKYTIVYPANVTEAILDITPLPDLNGYGTSNTGNTVNLFYHSSGSFELLPGYYLLNLTAKTGSTMAVWNELVHIYSGQETAADHTFAATDFSGFITLSGTIFGGELEGEHITNVSLIAYGDDKYLTRVASVEVPLNKPAGEIWYSGDWIITIPSSLVGKTLYLVAESTLTGGSAGTRNFTRYIGSDNHILVPEGGITGKEIGLEYYWWQAVSETLDEDSMTLSVAADGTVTVKTTQLTDSSWDNWKHILGLSYPAEVNKRYVYEFEAWTDNGTRDIKVVYVDTYDWDGNQILEDITINSTRKTYTIVSNDPHNSRADQYLKFFCGSNTVTGDFHIKMKSIKNVQDYIPPQPEGGRWSAAAANDGIKFTINLKDIPAYFKNDNNEIGNLVILNITTGNIFAVQNIPGDTEAYEVIFPYVSADKEYVFSIGSWSDKLADNITITATGGKGELGFSNIADLVLLKEGNTLKFNTTPALSVTEANAVDPLYTYELATGASWDDPSAAWQIAVAKVDPNDAIDLLDTSNFPDWADPASVLSALAGKTCFAQVFYTFDYIDDNIYPIIGSKPGFFRTGSITSAPFTYPSVIPDVFTLEPCPEGIKFTVDLTKIPPGTTGLQFYAFDWRSQFTIGSWQWLNPGNEFYGKNKVEVVYPFVTAGKTYQFGVLFNGTGTSAEATVTPTAGLGEVKYSNAGNIGMVYNSGTKTLTFNGLEKPVIQSDPLITRSYWNWQFWKGHNWDDGQWVDLITYEEPKTSIVFDETFFHPSITTALSNNYAYLNVEYCIEYAGRTFSFETTISPYFRFPYFVPLGGVTVPIRTAFETNSNLYLSYNSYLGTLRVYISDDNWYSHSPAYSFAFYIDGVKVTPEDIEGEYSWMSAYLPTTTLSIGRHYGLAVVVIDGAIFSKEFTFRVN